MGDERVTALTLVCMVAAALLMVVAGLTWLFGPYGLIGGGVALGTYALVVAEVRAPEREEQS